MEIDEYVRKVCPNCGHRTSFAMRYDEYEEIHELQCGFCGYWFRSRLLDGIQEIGY